MESKDLTGDYSVKVGCDGLVVGFEPLSGQTGMHGLSPEQRQRLLELLQPEDRSRLDDAPGSSIQEILAVAYEGLVRRQRAAGLPSPQQRLQQLLIVVPATPKEHLAQALASVAAAWRAFRAS